MAKTFMRGADLVHFHWFAIGRPCSRSARVPGMVIALLVLALCGGSALARQTPYKGVTESKVDVHSGGSQAFYEVGTLDKGTLVNVEETYHGWYKIDPPKGIYSYISQAFVNRQGDGSQGVVNRDRAEVKAASVKGPGFSYRVQSDLDRGDHVKIVSSGGGKYKIIPPEGTYVYLEPGSVRPATKQELAQIRKEAAKASVKKQARQGSNEKTGPSSNARASAGRNTQARSGAKSNSSSAGSSTSTASGIGSTQSRAKQNAKTAPASTSTSAERSNQSEGQGSSSSNAGNSSKQNRSTPAGDHGGGSSSASNANPRQGSNPSSPTNAGPNAKGSNSSAALNGPRGPSSGAKARTSQANSAASSSNRAGEKQTPSPSNSNSNSNSNSQANSKAKASGSLLVADSDGLATVDKKLKPLFKRPVQDQPIDQMIAAYGKFKGDDQLSRADRQLVKVRLASLRHNKKVALAIAQADQALSSNPAPPADQQVDISKMSPSQFDAVGILKRSSVYDGRNLPRMYRLVDASSQRTTAYLSPGKPINAKTMMGELVGVLGSSEFDASTKLQIIDVDRIAVLSAKSSGKGQSEQREEQSGDQQAQGKSQDQARSESRSAKDDGDSPKSSDAAAKPNS